MKRQELDTIFSLLREAEAETRADITHSENLSNREKQRQRNLVSLHFDDLRDRLNTIETEPGTTDKKTQELHNLRRVLFATVKDFKGERFSYSDAAVAFEKKDEGAVFTINIPYLPF